YGPPDFYDPLIGLYVPTSLRRKMDFVGFLQRSVSRGKTSINARKDNYILVTTGGGRHIGPEHHERLLRQGRVGLVGINDVVDEIGAVAAAA
ncbi:hypothetical protein ACC705_34445, partial [Rhizobium ruizarguesonis]